MFKDRLRERRKELKMSQRELAEKLFVSQQAIAKWETDKATPNPDMLAKLSEILGVSVDYLTKEDKRDTTDKDDLNTRDKKDIAKDMESIREKLMNKDDGPVSFDGNNIDDADAEMFLDAIEMLLKRVKKINKVKYNPNKNKPEQ